MWVKSAAGRRPATNAERVQIRFALGAAAVGAISVALLQTSGVGIPFGARLDTVTGGVADDPAGPATAVTDQPAPRSAGLGRPDPPTAIPPNHRPSSAAPVPGMSLRPGQTVPTLPQSAPAAAVGECCAITWPSGSRPAPPALIGLSVLLG